MFLILLITTILAVALVHQWRARRQLPRGPFPLPIIGNLHQLLFYCWKNGGIIEGYAEIEKSFGKVYTLWIGPLPTVFISDYDVAVETHIKRANVFGKRYAPGIMNYIRFDKGVVASNGDFWQDHRRFALTTLRNFGFGRNIMEERIMDEYRYRFEEFSSTGNNNRSGSFTTCARSFFDLLTGSVINKILINERFGRVGGHEKNNVLEIPFKDAPRGVELVRAMIEGAAPQPTEPRGQRESSDFLNF
ncbi:Protein CBG18638 [Caenorhabditis briggsae]|uniref:Protein CBG18638 n=1 Tax=Caenorhabditis briggsae TaxID=6238 RepID=A8XTS4_CAEBR|nr:Protein CBG18638 [Caenorhabditis briggsae]CAP36050.1 Protein CBG18638 [Caenorhabditis briggsae]